MPDKADHIAWAAEAIAVFQRHSIERRRSPIIGIQIKGAIFIAPFVFQRRERSFFSAAELCREVAEAATPFRHSGAA